MIMSNKIKKYRAMKHITNQISGILLLIAMSVLMISSESDPSLNDGTLYIMDLDDGSTYTTTCPDEISGEQWVVKNKTCTLTTSVINLPGDPETDPRIDIPINFSALRTGNLEAEDNIVLEYSIGGDWVEIAVFPGTELDPGWVEYGYRADNIAAGSSIQFRFIVKTDDISEKITLRFTSEDNTVFVGTPFYTGTTELFRSATLPVSLTDFYGQVSDKQVVLVWTTQSEINNRQFELEKSTNGYDFTTVTIVQGAGNSNTTRSYLATDYSPATGTSYYRLKQVDFDGTVAYSSLISVNFEGTDTGCKLKTVPNPCIGRCSFVMENCSGEAESNVSFYVYDALGNIVFADAGMIEPGSSAFSFDSDNGLKPGVYIVRGNVGDKSYEDKFLLQN